MTTAETGRRTGGWTRAGDAAPGTGSRNRLAEPAPEPEPVRAPARRLSAVLHDSGVGTRRARRRHSPALVRLLARAARGPSQCSARVSRRPLGQLARSARLAPRPRRRAPLRRRPARAVRPLPERSGRLGQDLARLHRAQPRLARVPRSLERRVRPRSPRALPSAICSPRPSGPRLPSSGASPRCASSSSTTSAPSARLPPTSPGVRFSCSPMPAPTPGSGPSGPRGGTRPTCASSSATTGFSSASSGVPGTCSCVLRTRGPAALRGPRPARVLRRPADPGSRPAGPGPRSLRLSA